MYMGMKLAQSRSPAARWCALAFPFSLRDTHQQDGNALQKSMSMATYWMTLNKTGPPVRWLYKKHPRLIHAGDHQSSHGTLCAAPFPRQFHRLVYRRDVRALQGLGMPVPGVRSVKCGCTAGALAARRFAQPFKEAFTSSCPGIPSDRVFVQ